MKEIQFGQLPLVEEIKAEEAGGRTFEDIQKLLLNVTATTGKFNNEAKSLLSAITADSNQQRATMST